MIKKATTIEEQIGILESRGMKFDCIEKAKEHLLDIGYYRLGFYWKPFEKGKKEKDGNHMFYKGTKFSTVIKLYYLDVDLRHILMKAINRIEINIRTKIIYTVSNKYKESPTWFVDTKVMKDEFVNTFDRYYTEQFKEYNKPLKRHHRKYINDRYAPAWKTLEFFSLGQILKVFFKLKNKGLKEKIALEYGIKKVYIFENYFKTMKFIRNICAHSSLLYDSNTPKEIKSNRLIKIHNNNTHSLDSSIKVILYFLSVISTTRKKELQVVIDNLFKENSEDEKIKKIIQEKIGYKFSQ